MLQVDSDLVNGLGGGAGGLGVGGVLMWILHKYGILGKKDSTGNGMKAKIETCATQINDIHESYGARGPIDRMTTQMEAVKDENKTQTIVLKEILDELRKD